MTTQGKIGWTQKASNAELLEQLVRSCENDAFIVRREILKRMGETA